MNWLISGGIVLTFATAVIGFVQTRRKLTEIHVLVNSQLQQVLTRVVQLTDTLEKAGVDVPDPPELGRPGVSAHPAELLIGGPHPRASPACPRPHRPPHRGPRLELGPVVVE